MGNRVANIAPIGDEDITSMLDESTQHPAGPHDSGEGGQYTGPDLACCKTASAVLRMLCDDFSACISRDEQIAAIYAIYEYLLTPEAQTLLCIFSQFREAAVDKAIEFRDEPELAWIIQEFLSEYMPSGWSEGPDEENN